MSEGSPTDKPLIEQIFDEMFHQIGEQAEFDSDTVTRLTQLAKTTGLAKPDQIVEVTKVGQETPDEAS